MKKYIILLIALFFLTSCDDETIEEAIEQLESIELEDDETKAFKEEFQEDPINKVIDEQDLAFKTSDINAEIKGEELNLFTPTETLSYGLYKSETTGLGELHRIVSEERTDLHQEFNPSFHSFFDILKDKILIKEIEIHIDEELKDAVNQDESYHFLTLLTTDGLSKFETELAIGSNGTLLYKLNNYQRPNVMLGESGRFIIQEDTPGSTYQELQKIIQVGEDNE